MNIIDVVLGPTFGKIIDKIFPDPAQKQAAQLQLLQLQQAGEFKELDNQLQRDLAQINVNNTEAQSADLFKSGWRPATGWVCVLGLGSTFLVRPYLIAFSGVDIPHLDMGTLLTLLAGLLGLGTLRTTEKIKGVA